MRKPKSGLVLLAGFVYVEPALFTMTRSIIWTPYRFYIHVLCPVTKI